MTQEYDYLIFIGRFQPYHSGHHHVALEALKISKNLIFVVGSHERARDVRNPFTTQERIDIIRAALYGREYDLMDAGTKESDKMLELAKRVHFAPQLDYTYNDDRWIASIQSSVNTIVLNKFSAGPLKVGIIGYNKDHSSYYLKKFPQWDLVEIIPKNECNATDLRRILFSDPGKYNEQYWINDFHRRLVIRYSNLPGIMEEWEFIEDYKKQWESSPYPVSFNTVDAVVTQSGHILVVTRKAMPGEGLLALPGGFVNVNEKLQDAVIRELKEETNINVPVPALIGSIAKVHTYDDPQRSARGRTFSHAYHFKLTDQSMLPKIKGGDDAANAKWMTMNDFVLNRGRFFEDHFSIAEHMLGL